MSGDDRDLRERFARLRAEEGRRAPRFAFLWARARDHAGRPGRRRLRPALAAAGALVLAALALYLRGGARPAPSSSPAASAPPLGLGTWRAPTDFLLDTPGRELLGGVPRLGRGLPGTFLVSPTSERSTSS